MSLLRRLAGGTKMRAGEPIAAGGDDAAASPAAEFVGAAFWIVLGRPVKPIELRDECRELSADTPGAFLLRLISSTEFRSGYDHWKQGRDRQHDPAVEESALRE